jgi:hypothetical protein
MVDRRDGSRAWDGGLEIDPVEAWWVGIAFEARVAGGSPGGIARAFNEENLATRIGGRWTAHTVAVLLANPVYTGAMVRYRRKNADHYFPEDDEIDGRREIGRPFPPIISDATFEEAQRRGARRFPDEITTTTTMTTDSGVSEERT